MEQLILTSADFAAFKTLSHNTDFAKTLAQYAREAQNLDLKPALGYPLFYDLLAKYGKEAADLDYNNLTVSVFAVAEIITADNGATAKVVTNSGTVLNISDLTGNWEAAKSITGGTSGAKADVIKITFGDWYQFVNGLASYTDYLGFTTGYEGIKPALIYWAYARYVERGQEIPTATGLVTKTTPYSEPLSARAIADKAAQAREAALAYWSNAEKFLYDKYIKTPAAWQLYAKTLYLKRRPGGGIKMSKVSRYDRENSLKNKTNCPDNGYGV